MHKCSFIRMCVCVCVCLVILHSSTKTKKNHWIDRIGIRSTCPRCRAEKKCRGHDIIPLFNKNCAPMWKQWRPWQLADFGMSCLGCILLSGARSRTTARTDTRASVTAWLLNPFMGGGGGIKTLRWRWFIRFICSQDKRVTPLESNSFPPWIEMSLIHFRLRNPPPKKTSQKIVQRARGSSDGSSGRVLDVWISASVISGAWVRSCSVSQHVCVWTDFHFLFSLFVLFNKRLNVQQWACPPPPFNFMTLTGLMSLPCSLWVFAFCIWLLICRFE